MTNSSFIGPVLDKGNVSTLSMVPDDALALLVLAHGAGAGMAHQHMTSLAEALAAIQIATLRFNFPGREPGNESGQGRPDRLPVCVATIDLAVKHAELLRPDLPLFAGGHSFGGRMTSHYARATCHTSGQPLKGLIYYSFPLHPVKKPSVERATHLPDVRLPMLFLSGTRDGLATMDLLEQTVSSLKCAKLHWLDTADHSYKVLKRTRTSSENIYHEVARVSRAFIDASLQNA